MGNGSTTSNQTGTQNKTPVGKSFSDIITKTSETAVSEGSIAFRTAAISRSETGEESYTINTTVKADISAQRVNQTVDLPVGVEEASPTSINIYTNGSKTFERLNYPTETEYDVYPTGQGANLPVTNQATLERRLAIEGTIWKQSNASQTVYKLQSFNKTAYFGGLNRTIEEATGRITVSDTGIIQSYRLKITRTDPETNETATFEQRFTLLSMGDSSVIEPEWVDEARPTRSGSSTVEPADEQAP
jgi:hypothetical protein